VNPAHDPEVTVLSFDLGEHGYAVDLGRTREILRYRRPTPLPRVPAFVEGVIAVRGAVTPVLDLRRRLGLAAAAPRPEHRLIVVNDADGETAALRVDRIAGVRRLRESDLRPPTEADPAVRAWVDSVEPLRILDLDAILELGADRG